MIFFFSILGICLVVTTISYFFSGGGICWKEVLLMIGIQTVVAGISAAISYHASMTDDEIWNSKVVNKTQDRVSCSHSYCCRHGTCGSGKNKYTCCKSTCYRHPYDFDWNVRAENGERWEISRIDSQGTIMPPRWNIVQMGEPTASEHSYDNFIKAASGSLFRREGAVEKYQRFLPQYPGDVYDYYRLSRLVLVNGAQVPDSQYWIDDISKLNSEIGQKTQSNIIVVVVKGLEPDFYYALEQHWLGGKKNDVVLVMNLDAARKPTWVQVMAWERNDIFKIKVRDELIAKETVERWDVYNVLSRNIVKYHQRKPMADFEYLTASFTPSVTHWVVTTIIGLLISIGLSVYFHHNETFPGYRSYTRYY